jgi:hypothetical protein
MTRVNHTQIVRLTRQRCLDVAYEVPGDILNVYVVECEDQAAQ